MIRQLSSVEVDLAQFLHPGPAWKKAHVNEGGQFHVVLDAEHEAVLRMSRTAKAAHGMQRGVELVEALDAHLSFELPTALTPVWHSRECSAVVQRYVPGSAHAPHRGDSAQLRNLVEHLGSIDVAPLAGLLAQPFAFHGPWSAGKTSETLRVLPAGLIADAELVLDVVAGFATVVPGLVHGDLAGHNMHWVDGRLVGVLDWDLAAAWDPALNSAYLGMWHGEALLEQIAATAQESRRARVWLGAMSLESIFDASLANDARRLAGLVAAARLTVRRSPRAR